MAHEALNPAFRDLIDEHAPVLQLTDIPVRTEFLQMVLYAGVVIALIVIGRNMALPAALGRPYLRGEGRGDV